MKKEILITLLLVLISCAPCAAALSTEELAARAAEGQKIFDRSVVERNRKVEQIMADSSKSPHAREVAVRNVQKEFLKNSRETHLKYREPFIQRVIAEANEGLPEGKKIRTGLGSDIYQRQKVTGRVLTDKKGRKILNPKHRGMQGDLDLGGDPRAVQRLEETFDQYKHLYLPSGTSNSVVTSKTLDAPGYRDFGDVEVTINISGEPDLPGSSAHQTRVQMDAFSKETYVSVSMRKNQAGRSLVETNDHVKKAAKGLAGPPADLLGWQGEKKLQGVGKGTLKSIESGMVDDGQLAKVLKESGYQGDITAFKHQLKRIKKGHLYQGVGLNEENVEAFQKACRKTTEQALDNARQRAPREMAEVQARIDKYEAKIQSGELSGEQLARHKKVTQQLRNELIDTKVKIEQTELANRVKLEGGTYDDYYQKNKLTNVTPMAAVQPKMSRIEAVKKGLKPGLLDVAGYGMSAYTVYDNISKMQKGEISQNEAVIGITKEVIDTGFGMVTDLGTAAAVGSIGTGTLGTVATVGAPLVVVAGAGYAVSTAAEEALLTVEAFKVEEIAEKIAKSKKEEVINTLQLQVEELVKAGEATGNWRFFAKADDIANSLERMYTVTGDDDFKRTFDTVYNRVTEKKEGLEARYNCSIYALQGKMAEAKAAAAADKAAEAAGPGPVQLAKSIAIQLSHGSDFDRGTAIASGQKLTSREGKLWAVSTVHFPESTEPQQVQVVWELLDAQEGVLFSKEEVKEGVGESVEIVTKIPVGKLNPGLYAVRLRQFLAAKPEEVSTDRAAFIVYEPVRIIQQWVTNEQGNTDNKEKLFAWDRPYLYVTYEADKALGTVLVDFVVTDKKTGEEKARTSAPLDIDPEKDIQRAGIALTDSQVKPGDEVTYAVTISPGPASTEKFQPVTGSLDFSVTAAELGIRLKGILLGDGPGNYTITPPQGFEPPFDVRVSGGGLEVNRSSNPLRGSYRGRASTRDNTFTMSFKVTDARGRSVRSTKEVTVKGVDPRTLETSNSVTEYLSPTPHGPSPEEIQAQIDAEYEAEMAENKKFSDFVSKTIQEQAEAKRKSLEEKSTLRSTPSSAYSQPSYLKDLPLAQPAVQPRSLSGNWCIVKMTGQNQYRILQEGSSMYNQMLTGPWSVIGTYANESSARSALDTLNANAYK